MKGQFMVISSIIISAIVISTASAVLETSTQEFEMDRTAYKLENIRDEAQKVYMPDPRQRENFRKLVESTNGYTTETEYWRSKKCFNVTLESTTERYRLTCIS